MWRAPFDPTGSAQGGKFICRLKSITLTRFSSEGKAPDPRLWHAARKMDAPAAQNARACTAPTPVNTAVVRGLRTPSSKNRASLDAKGDLGLASVSLSLLLPWSSRMRIAFLLISLLASSAAQAALVALSNLDEQSLGDSTVFSNNWFAAPFVAGESVSLRAVDLLMGTAVDPAGEFFVQIWSEQGGSPASALTALSGPNNPLPGVNRYTGQIDFTAGLLYFVVAGVSSGDGFYLWEGTDSLDYIGRPGWMLLPGVSGSNDQGSTWSVSPGLPQIFAVQVPAPSSVALLLPAIGLLWGIARRRRRASTVS